ncbi:MAG: cell division protein FtsA, partial [Gemmatimonadetes bacterium]|nr:cell division protein FtsA [Gemmatimonadota bacterium]
MIQDDYRAAVDIGTTKVCTVVGRRHPDGRVELAGIGVSPCRGLRRGLVSDVSATTEAVRASAAAAARAAGMPVRKAYISLTGSHVESVNRWNRVERRSDARTVTEDDLASAMEAASRFGLTDGRVLLHVIPRSYALDGIHGVRNPLGMHATDLHIQSHIITGATEPIETLKAAVRAAGITPAAAVVGPVGCADAVLTADERDGGVVLVDVGGGTTDVAVFFDGAIVHTAVIPVGGHQFTNDLAVAFATEYGEAERLKLKHGTAIPELAGMREEIEVRTATGSGPFTVTRREVGQLLNERARELFEMIRLKLATPHVQELPINRMVFTGGGAKLEGFQALGKYVFQCQARLGAPRGVIGLGDEHRDPMYAAALGVMLWGMRNLPRESHVGSHALAPARRSRGLLRGLRGRLPAAAWRAG